MYAVSKYCIYIVYIICENVQTPPIFSFCMCVFKGDFFTVPKFLNNIKRYNRMKHLPYSPCEYNRQLQLQSRLRAFFPFLIPYKSIGDVYI